MLHLRRAIGLSASPRNIGRRPDPRRQCQYGQGFGAEPRQMVVDSAGTSAPPSIRFSLAASRSPWLSGSATDVGVDGGEHRVLDRDGRIREDDVGEAGHPQKFPVASEPCQALDLQVGQVGGAQPAAGGELL